MLIKKITFLFLVLVVQIFSQTAPKREMRAAWLSTVRNIDWPKSPSNSTETKINNLINYIEVLKEANINTVVMQVRPASDAMYASNIEPWSSWLTGQQGKAPSPFFDPLKIAIEESHKRGMELHAWLNPYRVRLASYHLALAENNVAVLHPEWVLNIDGDEILDPGIPEVRQHIVNVIEDIILNYDVDAIHFDDYFYLEGITNQDDATFAKYPNGFTDKGDWRRDNVTELLRMIYAKIQEVKPRVKFGQSPAGIWKNGVPTGIYGRDNYSVIYCDPVDWLDEQVIDYLTPQLYWPFGGNQDYGKLAPWWASVRNERHIYPGLPFYRIDATSAPITDESQIGKMIKLNRKTEGIYGEMYFTSHNFIDNNGGITDTLTDNYYKYPALLPVMDWKDTEAPNKPLSLRFDRVSGTGTTALTWNIPSGEDIKFYVLYRSTDSAFDSTEISNPKNIFRITSNNFVQIDSEFPSGKAYYYVTALDWNNNESGVSNKFEYEPAIVLPDVPTLSFPNNLADDVRDTLMLVWNYANNASSYSLQLSDDAEFSNIIISESSLLDTALQVTHLAGETSYYWRVKAENLSGESNYSEPFMFTTAFPAAPIPLNPLHQELNVGLDTVFTWNKNSNATSYIFQLSEGWGITEDLMVADTMITDTSFFVSGLRPGTFYAWRVLAINNFGKSLWSQLFQLKTKVILPDMPVLISPAPNQSNLTDSVTFVWQKGNYTDDFYLQVSLTETFSNRLFDIRDYKDTTITLGKFDGATTYYWRVRAENNGGSSNFTPSQSFSTGYPKLPELIYPGDLSLEKELDAILTWSKTELADNYSVQLSEGLSLNESKLLIDTTVTDTSLQCSALEVNTIYSWRVKAGNNIGESEWTDIFKFKTAADTLLEIENENMNLPEDYYLDQNFPNPFNPTTTITFGIPEAGSTSLRIYNIIGQEISVLINEELQAGTYSVNFDATDLTSGLYLYKLQSKDFISIKKMVLVK